MSTPSNPSQLPSAPQRAATTTADAQASLPTVTFEQLQDPKETALNNVLQFLGSQIASLQGATGPIQLKADVKGKRFFSSTSDIPTDPTELLTLGAANSLFNPNVMRDALVSKQWFGQTVKPLPSTGGGVTPPPSGGSASFTVVYGEYGHICMEAAIAGTVPFEMPSVDEVDADFWYPCPAMGGGTNPLTIPIPVANAASRFGRVPAAGDYFLIADQRIVGPVGFAFEVFQLLAINTAAATWQLSRLGQFGSVMTTHAAGIPMYRLVDQFFEVTKPLGSPLQDEQYPWPNKCVVAVQVKGGQSVSLLPTSSAARPTPGLRTLNGAMYTLGNPGSATVGTTSILRLKTANWASIRNAFFEFDGPAGTGAGSTLIALVYIDPTRGMAYLIGTITITSPGRNSWLAPQQNLRLPDGSFGVPPRILPLTWPPHVQLPQMIGALNATGQLITGFSINPSSVISIQEDGEVDYIVTAAPATPGTGLRGTVQT